MSYYLIYWFETTSCDITNSLICSRRPWNWDTFCRILIIKVVIILFVSASDNNMERKQSIWRFRTRYLRVHISRSNIYKYKTSTYWCNIHYVQTTQAYSLAIPFSLAGGDGLVICAYWGSAGRERKKHEHFGQLSMINENKIAKCKRKHL